MSGVGIISSQYTALVQTSDDINDAVILMKKDFFKFNDPEKSSLITFASRDLNDSKILLAGFINFMIKLSEDGDQIPSSNLPKKTIKELKTMMDGQEGLTKLLKSILRFLKNNRVLSMMQLDLLDDIVGILNHERGLLFNKLRTIRG